MNFRIILGLTLILALAACGGSRSAPVPKAKPTIKRPYAEGPIFQACLKAGRKAASRDLCGCAQAVANRELTSRDRARAETFYADPQLAQDARTADNSATRAFWKRYRAYATTAERSCRGA